MQFNATNDIFDNNIVYAGARGLLVHFFTKLGASPVTLDHNLYYATAGAAKAQFDYGKRLYVGFANYRQATGQDAHSVFADPLFDRTAPPVLLDVMAGSPAFGLGAELGASVIGSADIAGAARVQDGAVTAGAYEQ